MTKNKRCYYLIHDDTGDEKFIFALDSPEEMFLLKHGRKRIDVDSYQIECIEASAFETFESMGIIDKLKVRKLPLWSKLILNIDVDRNEVKVGRISALGLLMTVLSPILFNSERIPSIMMLMWVACALILMLSSFVFILHIINEAYLQKWNVL